MSRVFGEFDFARETGSGKNYILLHFIITPQDALESYQQQSKDDY